MKERIYYVYIATNKRHTVLYAGVTSDMIGRYGKHKEKYYKNSFTARYNINQIVYFESYGEIGSAIFREKQIKNLKRIKKIKLINSLNPQWNNLLDEI